MKGHRHKILFINGPPGCGKDEAARIVVRNFNARKHKMAGPIKAAFAATYNLSAEWALCYCEGDQKDDPQQFLREGTPRKWMQDFSEKFMKPLYGQSIFGHLALHKLQGHSTSTDLTVISDSGFTYEAFPLVKGFLRSNCACLKIERDGRTFEGDTRDWLDTDLLEIKSVTIINNLPLDMFEVQVCSHAKRLLNIEPRTTILEE